MVKHRQRIKTYFSAFFTRFMFLAPPRNCSLKWPGSAGNSQHGTGNQHHVALDNGGAGNENIALFRAAVFLKNGIQYNDNHAVRSQNQKRGNSQTNNFFHNQGRKCLLPKPRNLYGNFLPCEETKSKGAGGKLRDNGGNGCSGNFHIQNEDKNRIQNDIGNGSDKNGIMPMAGKPWQVIK